MSFPTLLATKEFFKLLTKKEIIQVKSRIIYMNAKYNFDNNNLRQNHSGSSCRRRLYHFSRNSSRNPGNPLVEIDTSSVG